MKKLKHIINWTIWSLFTIYVVAVILIHLPFVQRWMGGLVAGALSSKLGTEVSVGRVDLGFFNRIIIDDVNIMDQQSQKLLQARRMSLKIELLPLLDGRVSISSAQLLGADIHLRRDSAGATPNFQFVIDAFKKPDDGKPSKTDIRVGSLIVRRMSLSYDQLDAPATPGRLNPHHLKLSDVSAHISLRTLTADSLHLNVKRIALHEQAGLQLDQLSFKIEGNRRQALLTDFLLQMPGTALRVDTLAAAYVLDSLASTIRYETCIKESRIDLNDLRCLLPQHIPTAHALLLSTALSGTANSMDCQQLHLSTPDGALVLQARGLYSRQSWQANIEQLYLADKLTAEVADSFPTLPRDLVRLGNISLHAQANGASSGSMNATGQLSTALGTVSADGSMVKGEQWSAHVHTDSLDVHLLAGQELIGIMAADLQLNGHGQMVNVSGTLPRIDLKGYTYSDVALDGVYSPTSISGKLKVNDSHLQADVEGSYQATERHLLLTGYIAHIAPQALHLSDRWGNAAFSAIVDADVKAATPNDIKGTIDLDDFTMTENDTTHYHLDNLHVKADNKEDGYRLLRLGSDFGEAELSGHFEWNTLAQSLLAVIPPESPLRPMAGKGSKKANNDFSLSVELSDSRWMQQLLGIQLDLDGSLSLQANVIDELRQMDVHATIPSFTYGTANYLNARLDLTAQGDSTLCDASVTRLTGKGNPIYLKLNTQAKSDQLISALSIYNEGNSGGVINTIARIYHNDKGEREAHIRVLPSTLRMRDAAWELEPCDILYSDKRLMIDQFTLHHDNEHVNIDGIASTQQNDSLMLDLQGIDIASLLDLVGFRAVKFGGRATGEAYVCHAFSQPDAWADLTVDAFHFQQAPMGTLEAHVEWNAEEKQIDLEAAIDDGAESQTYVDGFVSPQRKELDLGIRARGTSIAFVHSFTRSFMGRLEGHAYGDVRLHGPLKQLDLDGEAVVNGWASITPLGTTYTFSNDTVRMSPGTIALDNFIAYDRDQHTGMINGAINHQHFKNISFNLNATASNLLVYNFPDMDSHATIGGRVWADGEATLAGRPGEVIIDCDATPTPGSVFIYNAANPDAINRQQFITWGEAHPAAPEGTATALQPGYKSTAAATGSGRGTSDLRMYLRINATPDATLRLIMDQHSGDFITLGGNGTLRAAYYNKGPFQLFGTYNVERGIYSMTIQNILKKNFQFQMGSSLVFGGDPLQAALNLKALHTVNGVSLSDLGLGNSFTSNTIRVNCLMNIVGTAGEPRVEFDLEMPTVNSEEEQMIRSIITSEQELNQQVVYLLGIGRFYTQGANNAATQSYGQTELAMQSLLSGTVSSQINQLLTQVIKNDDWNFGANISTGNEGWHNAEYEGLISGRMLNNRLLLNGQFGYRDNATQATPSFIGDFDLRYLLTPNGSIALKAYNQTNDRYFTHSSLNTQGVGIILKKDFNGLRDLFRRSREHGRHLRSSNR